MYALYSSTIKNIQSLFQYNSAQAGYGIIYSRYNVDIMNTTCRFISNMAQFGGAIYIKDGGTAINTDCDFIDNYALSDGGGI